MALPFLIGTSGQDAQKELPIFATLAGVVALLGLFIFPVFGIASAGFSARAFALTFHEGNKQNSKLRVYRVVSALVLILSLLEAILNLRVIVEL